MNYKIIEDDWKDLEAVTASFSNANEVEKKLPIAIEFEAAFLFRELNGKIFHKYKYPFTRDSDVTTITHWLSHLAGDDAPEREAEDLLKTKIILQVFFCLTKLSGNRKKVNILEIGSTVGENCHLIKKLVNRYHLELEISFVGIDISAGLCQFARVVNQNDPNSHFIAGEGSDYLSKFPDHAFDIVICNGVINYTYDQKKALRELMRVTRFALCLMLQITTEEKSFYLTEGPRGWHYFFPTYQDLRDAWQPYFPLYDYLIYQLHFANLHHSSDNRDYYIGQDDNRLNIYFENHVVSRVKLF